MQGRFIIVSLAAALLAVPAPGAADAGDPNPSVGEWIEADVRIVFVELDLIRVEADLDVREATIFGRLFSADRAREVYGETRDRAGPTAAAGFASELESALTDVVKGRLDALFPSAEVAVEPARLDVATLELAAEGPRYDPPVVFRVNATAALDLATYGVEDLTEDKIRTALRIGARLKDDLPLEVSPGWNLTYRVELPAGIVFERAEGAIFTSFGNDAATWRGENWREAVGLPLPAALTLAGRGAPDPDAKDASVLITIDIRDVDIGLPGGKGVGALDVGVVLDAEMRALELPAEALAGLEALDMAFVTSDGVRLALAEGLVAGDVLVDAEDALLKTVAATLRAATGQELVVAGGFAPGTLDAALVGEAIDDEPPLMFQATTDFAIDLGLTSMGPRASGITLYTLTQSLDLVPLEGVETRYKVVFPRGIDVLDVDVAPDRGTAEVGKEGGREHVLVALTSAGPARAEFTLAVTPTFILAEILVPLLVALLLIVLLLALVAVALRKRKRGRRPSPSGGATAKRDRWFGEEP